MGLRLRLRLCRLLRLYDRFRFLELKTDRDLERDRDRDRDRDRERFPFLLDTGGVRLFGLFLYGFFDLFDDDLDFESDDFYFFFKLKIVKLFLIFHQK